jgi:predicted P-loop ATPase/GTPase
MNKIEYALKLAKDCTYADIMMESAKEHLRNVIDEALKEVLPQADVMVSFYCNQDDGEYNNNPCAEQCNFCKEVEKTLQ